MTFTKRQTIFKVKTLEKKCVNCLVNSYTFTLKTFFVNQNIRDVKKYILDNFEDFVLTERLKMENLVPLEDDDFYIIKND